MPTGLLLHLSVQMWRHFFPNVIRRYFLHLLHVCQFMICSCINLIFSFTRTDKGLRRVAGAPVIRQLSKKRSDDGQHELLICEAEGSPKPSVYWSINGTSVCKLIYLTNRFLLVACTGFYEPKHKIKRDPDRKKCSITISKINDWNCLIWPEIVWDYFFHSRALPQFQ